MKCIGMSYKGALLLASVKHDSETYLRKYESPGEATASIAIVHGFGDVAPWLMAKEECG